MAFEDTIAAISTALQPAGLGVIRISGKNAVPCAESLFVSSTGRLRVTEFPDHHLVHGWIMDGDHPVDEVLVTLMRAPNSYTTEDVVEIHAHGSVLGLQSILELILSQDVRLARPGEFTERAFLGGRLDLTKVEAVADLIYAQSDTGLKLAARQLKGRLYETIEKFKEELIGVASLVEATIEFPDENVKFDEHGVCLSRLKEIRTNLDEMLTGASQGRRIREGIGVALIGKPNVGKSSLLNILLKEKRAIVTSVPGTTRDIIEETLQIQGLAFRMTDTAGIRNSEDLVESEGIRRSQKAWQESDLTLLVLDVSGPLEEEDYLLLKGCEPSTTIVVVNKSDLCLDTVPDWSEDLWAFETLTISAKFGVGIDLLKETLYKRCTHGFSPFFEGIWLTNLRQQQSAELAWEALDLACKGLEEGQGEELVALDLRRALKALGSIVGETTTDDLLARIFSEFCIGK